MYDAPEQAVLCSSPPAAAIDCAIINAPRPCLHPNTHAFRANRPVCLCPTAKAVSDAFPVVIRGACKHQERDYEGAVADYDLALKTMGGENHVDYAGEGLPFQLTRLAKRTRAQTCHLYTYNIFVYMCVFVCVSGTWCGLAAAGKLRVDQR